MGCRLSLKESSVSIFRTSLLTQNVFFSESPVCIQACTRDGLHSMASFRCNGFDAMDYNELTTCDIRLSQVFRSAVSKRSPPSIFRSSIKKCRIKNAESKKPMLTTRARGPQESVKGKEGGSGTVWSALWEVGAVHRFGKRGAPAPRSSPGSSCTPRPAVIGTSRPTNSAFRRMLLAICPSCLPADLSYCVMGYSSTHSSIHSCKYLIN